MASAPKKLTDPSQREKWQKAKKRAQKLAENLDKKSKSKDQQNELKELSKSFKSGLGPALDEWGKLYPDYAKMERLRKDGINTAIKKYLAAIDKSDVDDTVKDCLRGELTDIKAVMRKRADLAEDLIGSDEALAVKLSKKDLGPPIVVFQHPDIGRAVLAKYTPKNVDLAGKVSIEVVIGDDEVRGKFTDKKDHSNAAAKIKDAGDFDRLIGDVAEALERADKNFSGGSSLSKEEAVFRGAIDDAIDDAVARATKEAARLGGLRAKARWATVKRGGKLTLSMAGAAASIAGLASTPFTAGASTIIGIIGLANASASIGRQLADIASTAEMMAAGIAKDLNTLKKQYGKWAAEARSKGETSNKVGAAEMGKRAANALVPAMLTTLKSVQGDADTYEEKVDKLEVKADRLGDNLDEWLGEQKKAQGEYTGIQRLGRDALDDKETALLEKILAGLAKTEKAVGKLIDAVTSMNARVAKNRRLHAKLLKELGQLSSTNPTWSEVGSALFEASAGAAFLIGGNVNTPDPYKFAETASKIATAVSATTASIEALEGVATDLADAVESRKAKVRK